MRWRSCVDSAAAVARQPLSTAAIQDHSAIRAACRKLNLMRAAVMGNPHIDLRVFRLDRRT